MKKLILFFVILVLIGISSAYAQEWPIKTKMITADSEDISELKAGVFIFGMKVVAKGGSNAALGIYDTTSLADAKDGTTDPIDEVTEATQGETAYSPLPQPYKVENGTSALIFGTSAIGFVYYRN